MCICGGGSVVVVLGGYIGVCICGGGSVVVVLEGILVCVFVEVGV